jgi:hypothetical protein
MGGISALENRGYINIMEEARLQTNVGNDRARGEVPDGEYACGTVFNCREKLPVARQSNVRITNHVLICSLSG